MKALKWGGKCNGFSDGELAISEEGKIGDFF